DRQTAGRKQGVAERLAHSPKSDRINPRAISRFNDTAHVALADDFSVPDAVGREGEPRLWIALPVGARSIDELQQLFRDAARGHGAIDVQPGSGPREHCG